MGKETLYTVEFNKKSYKDETGDLVFKSDRSALPPNVIENYKDLAYDLNSVYHRKNYNELRDILLHTLSVVGETVPEAVLPGFSLSSPKVVVSVPEVKSVAKGKVALNLSSSDDDDDEPPFDMTPSKSVDSDLESIKNLADSVLGD